MGMSSGRVRVRGTVRAITLRNVNKARGRYTFRVELTLERPDEDPLVVRVGTIHWERLTEAERAELAPSPGPTLRLERHGEWTVGQTAELVVELTSPGLAHWLR
jgi:hypothetical protein